MTGEHGKRLEQIYLANRRSLFACALAVTRCPDLAEDALHEAFCRLSRNGAHAENLRAYVFKAVRNAAFDQLRAVRRPAEELTDSIFDPAPGPSQEASRKEFNASAAAALGGLSDDERETIVLHLWGNLSFREIAELRAAPLGSVVSWYRRGIGRMREWMKE